MPGSDRDSAIPDNNVELADKARLISFSDNVISIAITLLVLDVRLPADFSNLTVTGILSAVWPRLLGFVLSFTIVGVYWVGHHLMLRSLVVAPRSLLWANNLFLLFISLIPASAALMGGHPDKSASAILYGLNIACVALSLMLLWFLAERYHHRHGMPIDPRISRMSYMRSAAGCGVALTGVCLSAVSPWVSYVVFWTAPLTFVAIQLAPVRSESDGTS
jgi:uncharacterized membrane protein